MNIVGNEQANSYLVARGSSDFHLCCAYQGTDVDGEPVSGQWVRPAGSAIADTRQSSQCNVSLTPSQQNEVNPLLRLHTVRRSFPIALPHHSGEWTCEARNENVSSQTITVTVNRMSTSLPVFISLCFDERINTVIFFSFCLTGSTSCVLQSNIK